MRDGAVIMGDKTKTAYCTHQAAYTWAKILLVTLSAMLFGALVLVKMQQKQAILQLIQDDLIFNIVYLLSMLDAICFFELYYYGTKLKTNDGDGNAILGILSVAIAQLALLNLVISGLLLYFIAADLKWNDLRLREIFVRSRRNSGLKNSILNFLFLGFTIFMIYVMIHHRLM